MIMPLLALFLFGQGVASPPPLAVRDFPRSCGPAEGLWSDFHRVEANHTRGVRGSWGTGRVNPHFDPDFRNSPFASMRVENVDILQAFDRVSLLTGNFVEVLDSKPFWLLRTMPRSAVSWKHRL
jgi:hypothetical protein